MLVDKDSLLILFHLPSSGRVVHVFMSVKPAKKENVDVLHGLSWWRFVDPVVEFKTLGCSVSNNFLFTSLIFAICIFVMLSFHVIALNMVHANWPRCNGLVDVDKSFIISRNLAYKFLGVSAARHNHVNDVKKNTNSVQVLSKSQSHNHHCKNVNSKHQNNGAENVRIGSHSTLIILSDG